MYEQKYPEKEFNLRLLAHCKHTCGAKKLSMTHESEILSLRGKVTKKMKEDLSIFDQFNEGGLLWPLDRTLGDAFDNSPTCPDSAKKCYKSYREKSRKAGGQIFFPTKAQGRTWGVDDQRQFAIDQVTKRYKDAMGTWHVPSYTDYDLESHTGGMLEYDVRNAMDLLLTSSSKSSTPGWMLEQLGSTNGDVIAAYPGLIRELVKERIRKIYTTDDPELFEDLSKDRVKWLVDNWSEPHRVFKKNSPNGSSKPLGRIVMGENTVDQLVHMVLFSGLYEAESAAYPNCPNLRGHGTDQEKVQQLYDNIQEFSRVYGRWPTSSDITGWESGFGIVLLRAVVEVMNDTHTVVTARHTIQKERALKWFENRLMTNILAFDDGALCSQIDDNSEYGDESGLRSGNKLTGTVNGIGRQLMAAFVGSDNARTNGDDAGEWHRCAVEELIRRYRLTNTIQRDIIGGAEYDHSVPYNEASVPFDFNSHTSFRHVETGRAGIYLLTWPRMLFMLVSKHGPGTPAAATMNFSDLSLAILSETADHPDKVFKLVILGFLLDQADRRGCEHVKKTITGAFQKYKRRNCGG